MSEIQFRFTFFVPLQLNKIKISWQKKIHLIQKKYHLKIAGMLKKKYKLNSSSTDKEKGGLDE